MKTGSTLTVALLLVVLAAIGVGVIPLLQTRRAHQAVSFGFLASADARIGASVLFLGCPDTRDAPPHTPEPHLAATLEVRENARTIFLVPAVA